MTALPDDHGTNDPSLITRRRFIAGTGASVLAFTVLKPGLVRGAEANSKIDIGLIGCGNRGKWIADLFQKNGGYNIVAVADYFQDHADEAGAKFNVPAANRYTGLSGYRKLLEQKLDAVVIESPPYFHPEQAAAAIDAGKHVYLAKPIAVDVPGCQTVAESGKKATAKKLCFQVDFQTRANKLYQDAVKAVHDGEIGKIVSVEANYQCGDDVGQHGPAPAQGPEEPRGPPARLGRRSPALGRCDHRAEHPCARRRLLDARRRAGARLWHRRPQARVSSATAGTISRSSITSRTTWW